MECVATLVTQLVLTRVESKTVMACTKGTPVDQGLHIGTGGLVDVILTSNCDFVILTRKYRSAL